MHTKDRKKERLLVFSIIIGMVVVLVVWGFQLHNMFTNTVAKEGSELSQEYQDTIDELELFTEEFDQRFPEVTQDLGGMLNMIEQEQLQQKQALQEAQDEVIESVALEAALKLQEQAAQEVQDAMEDEE